MAFDWTDADHDGDHSPDPGSVPVAIDANALDRNGRRDEAIGRFLTLIAAGRVTLRVGDGVRLEMAQAGLGPHVGDGAVVTTGPSRLRSLTAAEHIARIRVRAILCGNAKPGKHDADAVHVSEAAEAGCAYFITYDSRILRKRDDLQTIAVPSMRLVTVEEFLDILDEFEHRSAESSVNFSKPAGSWLD